MWGANLLTTAHHHWHFITQARKLHGARIVVIDPIRTRTANAADEHIAIKPGTDAALALGLAHVLVAEGLAHVEHSREWVGDVDEYPAVSLPDTTTVRKGFARTDLFTVVIEHFMTDTAMYADIVLPSTTQLEHFDMLRMLTPKGHFFMNTSFANMPRQRKAMKTPTLEIHAEDATARKLVDGQHITVFNEQGSITTQIHISEAVRPGVVVLPGKWWSHPTETGAVANFLSPPAWSPGGQPAYNDIFVDITPAEPQ